VVHHPAMKFHTVELSLEVPARMDFVNIEIIGE
jgi:hypothetical protein